MTIINGKNIAIVSVASIGTGIGLYYTNDKFKKYVDNVFKKTEEIKEDFSLDVKKSKPKSKRAARIKNRGRKTQPKKKRISRKPKKKTKREVRGTTLISNKKVTEPGLELKYQKKRILKLTKPELKLRRMRRRLRKLQK